MEKINKLFEAVFTENEIQALKDAWRYGAWGDSEVNFGDGEEWGLGACTNDIKKGGHFSGRQISGIVSSISKKADEMDSYLLVCEPDWWGDGSGDMVFFNIEALGYDNSDDAWKALNEWSKS